MLASGQGVERECDESMHPSSIIANKGAGRTLFQVHAVAGMTGGASATPQRVAYEPADNIKVATRRGRLFERLCWHLSACPLAAFSSGLGTSTTFRPAAAARYSIA
jgi:hypothetical protein